MVANRPPGATLQRVEARGGRFELLRADIAGFVGIAARGPLHRAVRVSGRKQFEAQFGRPIPQAYLGAAVNSFFENGGRDCYVVRVAHPADAAPAAVRVYDGDLPLFTLEATSPGVWGRAIRVLARRAGDGAANLFIQLRDDSRTVEIRRGVPLSDEPGCRQRGPRFDAAAGRAGQFRRRGRVAAAGQRRSGGRRAAGRR